MTGIITMAGQSNAVGFRSNPGLLPSSTKDANIPFSHNNQGLTAPGEYMPLGPILVEDGGGNGWTEDVTVPAGFSSWGYGAEITCARSLHSESRPVAVAKRATGSTDLDTYWNPQPAGIGWNGVMDYANGLFDTLQSEGRNPYHLCAIYWQGENDASLAGASSRYEYNLRRWIAFFRANAKNAQLPIVVALTTTGSSTYRAEVQAAQQRIAATDEYVRLYDPSGLPTYSDGVHFWQDAHVTSGNAIAELFESMGL